MFTTENVIIPNPALILLLSLESPSAGTKVCREAISIARPIALNQRYHQKYRRSILQCDPTPHSPTRMANNLKLMFDPWQD